MITSIEKGYVFMQTDAKIVERIIEDEHVGVPRPGHRQDFHAVGSLADDHDIHSASFDRQPQPVPDHRMIIGKDNANAHILGCRLLGCSLLQRQAHAHRGSFPPPGINREDASGGSCHFLHRAEAYL